MVQNDIHVEGIITDHNEKPWTSQRHHKSHFDVAKHAFLGKEFHSFHLTINELDYLRLKVFLHRECESSLKQLLAPPQHKIIVAYRTINNGLAIETNWWSTIPNLKG